MAQPEHLAWPQPQTVSGQVHVDRLIHTPVKVILHGDQEERGWNGKGRGEWRADQAPEGGSSPGVPWPNPSS